MKYVDTVKELLFVYAMLVLIGAAVYAHLEETTYLHAVWWACVTALTVGYGDMYPATLGGKIIAVVLMHASVLFILPLLIGNICSLCVKNQNEFTHQEQEEIKLMLLRLENQLNAMSDKQRANTA
jgi:voltage-gated potassium channel